MVDVFSRLGVLIFLLSRLHLAILLVDLISRSSFCAFPAQTLSLTQFQCKALYIYARGLAGVNRLWDAFYELSETSNQPCTRFFGVRYVRVRPEVAESRQCVGAKHIGGTEHSLFSVYLSRDSNNGSRYTSFTSPAARLCNIRIARLTRLRLGMLLR